MNDGNWVEPDQWGNSVTNPKVIAGCYEKIQTGVYVI